MGAWAGFFQTQAGASASLLGLVFVGLSINFSRIISSRYLPNRALEALLALALNLTVASLALVPTQSVRAFAWETLVLALILWVSASLLHGHTHRNVEAHLRRRAIAGTLLGQLTGVVWVAGAVGLLIAGPSGVGFLVPGFLLSYALAVMIAWVLLVEINR